ncbi:DUF2777 domain-containing protein [Bacillus mesophilum]|uniref:DUF2777 domain-containing protein n=1 Tax=Bacillus mesophilum TaxID=1071718 RepID=A0A7V7RJC2_9BACI|nr:DUF2777 domain-containing protein [Bacillus mesophilum]KAB2330915.1 DUF2777 domain-containing protein [Bacillus mesophilum]
MKKQQRIKLIEYQTRAFTEGNVEYINDQWIFFDRETDEAAMLDDYLHMEIELARHKRWKKGKLAGEGKIACSDELVFLKDQDTVRIRKSLVFALEKLLDELNDDAFYQFVTTLNSMQFSIYDCIYCYNQLTFVHDEDRKSGVNFIIFDNQEHICSVQHHFSYYEGISDRFEFTLNTGKRMVIEKISS